MKKLLIAILAVLLLAACASKEAPVPPVEEPEIVQPPVEEAPVEAPKPEPVPEVPVEEPAEPSPLLPVPEELPEEQPFSLERDVIHVEGLIEDTIAYDLEQLVVSGVEGAEQINGFYEELVQQLEAHTKENIYPAVMEQHTGANVYGIVTHMKWDDTLVEVVYVYRVEYFNGTEPEEFTRTDHFDAVTGEKVEAGEDPFFNGN